MALGIDLGYFIFYQNRTTNATTDDIDYICSMLDTAIKDRGMVCGGGAYLKDEDEED